MARRILCNIVRLIGLLFRFKRIICVKMILSSSSRRHLVGKALKQLHIGLQEANVETEPKICAPEQKFLDRIPLANTCLSYHLPTRKGMSTDLPAIDGLVELGVQKTFISREDAYWLVQDCQRRKDLVGGRLLHSLMLHCGLDSLAVLMDHLIRLFAHDGSLVEAYCVFNKIAKPSAYSWSAIISATVHLGEVECAIELYYRTQVSCPEKDKYSLVYVLKACSLAPALMQGRLIHSQLLQSELKDDVFAGSALIDAYSKCGSLEEAEKSFHNLQNQNIVSWGAMIAGYAQNENSLSALKCFENMQVGGIVPNEVTFLSALKACSTIGVIQYGRVVHVQIIRSGLQSNIVVGSTLLDMYIKCGSLEEAHAVFDKLPERNVVSWSAIIAGYAEIGDGLVSLECFESMQNEGIMPNRITFLGVLGACACIGAVQMGRLIHEQIIGSPFQSDDLVQSCLVDIYAKCGCLDEAQFVFERLLNRDVVAWGALIAGYAQHGEFFLAQACLERMQFEGIKPNVVLWGAMIAGYVRHGDNLIALEHYEKMKQEGIKPNELTFASVLKACASTGAIESGRLIHDHIISACLQPNVIVGTALIDMYGKCGNLDEAHGVFGKLPDGNGATWGALIGGYAQHGDGRSAIKCFAKMQQMGINPNEIVFLNILKACANARAIEHGRLIHDQIIQSRLETDVLLCNTMIDMYAKCGSLEEAHKVFDNLQDRDMISWNAMITGYAQHQDCLAALECYEKMQKDCLVPNEITILSVLKACAGIGAIEHGRRAHDQIIKVGLQSNALGSCLVDMYAKCGSLQNARKVFEQLPNPSIVSWNAMVAGYAQNGDSVLALECFGNMQKNGLKPNEGSFASILVACSRAGQVNEGLWYFLTIKECYDVTPTIVHHTSLIDLLSRAGYLIEAEDLYESSVQPNIIGWMSLLSACKMHDNVKLGAWCFDQIIASDTSFMSGYAVMSNIYAVYDECQGAL